MQNYKQQRYLSQPSNSKTGQFESYKDNPRTKGRTTSREKEQIISQIRELLNNYGLSYKQASKVIQVIKGEYEELNEKERVFGRLDGNKD